MRSIVKIKILLTTCAMLATSLSASADNVLQILEHTWNTGPYDVITELTGNGNNVYTGTLSFAQGQTIILSYNGQIYKSEEYQPEVKEGIDPANPYIFKPVSAGTIPGSYIQFDYTGSFGVKATVSDDASSIAFELLSPTPLLATINGEQTTLSDNISGFSGNISIPTTLKAPATISSITAGGVKYGVQATPAFDANNNSEQTLTANLVENGSDISLNISGTYTASLTITDGKPTSATITRGEVVPEMYVNNTLCLFNGQTRKYEVQVDLRKNTAVTISYENTLYYPTANLTGDGEQYDVNLSTGGSGKTDAKGTYSFIIDITAKTLSYKNLTPPGESTLSPTISDNMLDCTAEDYSPEEQNSLWYIDDISSMGWLHTGADQDSHDIHLGNGHLGVSMLGVVGEKIMLNEKTYFEGSRPTDYSAATAIGEYKRAGYLCTYMSISDAQTYNFIEQLDMMKGVGTTRITPTLYSGGQPNIYKEYLVSRPDDVFALYITSGEQTFNIELAFDELTFISRDVDSGYFSARGDLTTVSTCFACRAIPDGGASITTYNDNGIKVTGARQLLILVSSKSNYDITRESYIDESVKIESAAKAIVDAAASRSWQELYDRHVADHSALMQACTIDLDISNDTPTNELLSLYKNGNASDIRKRTLEQLLFQYGRYKTIGSSRKGDQLPNNLRGIWMSAQRWNGDIHSDLNIEMNYWPAENTNLSSCHEPFLDYIITMSGKTEWKGYAQYRAPGADSNAWTLDNANNIFGAAQSYISTYSESNAWFCYHLWQHWLYTLDRQFLTRAVPVMMNACKFWEKKMTWDSSLNKWICPEVWSPENGSGGNTAVHARQMVRELFKNTITGIETLGSDFAEGQAHLAELKSIFNDIDPGLHIVNGALCEWYGIAPSDDGHRHLSHLMCLYPMAQVSPYDSDLTTFNAAVNALGLRGDGDGGEAAVWNNAWKMGCRARALDNGEWGAYHQLGKGIGFLFDNLNASTANVHQIDGNSGMTAGIAEMLLQSYSGVIDILPVLPDEWADGSFSGMKTVGNFEVSASWSGNAIEYVKINNGLSGTRAADVRIRIPYGKTINDLLYNNTTAFPQNSQNGVVKASEALTYTYDSATDTYIIHLSEVTPAGSILSFKEVTTGIEEFETDNDEPNAPVEFYDLQGRLISQPNRPGIYIRRQGTEATKILIR